MYDSELALLYDPNCPFCAWYSSLFVRFGMLPSTGRIPYHVGTMQFADIVNADIARNRIALVQRRHGTVMYGVDSLLFLIGRRLPWVPKIGHIRPVHWLLTLLYSFISYNRNVIIPSDCSNKTSCSPDVAISWRVTFVVATTVASCFAASGFLSQLGIASGKSSAIWVLVISHTISLIAFQTLALHIVNQHRTYEYIGNLATISAYGSLLLLVEYIFLQLLHVGVASHVVYPAALAITVTAMFFEHRRRLRLLHLPTSLAITWTVFHITFAAVIHFT